MAEIDKIVFATFFPLCENIHLTKDVGMIPYILYRDFGYDSYLICYKNGDYPYLETESPGLKLLFMKKSLLSHFLERIIKAISKRRAGIAGMLEQFCMIIDAFSVILRYGKQINVLQLYFLDLKSIIMGLIYKVINRKGILYLKLDMNPDIIKSYEEHPEKLKKGMLLLYFPFKLASFDIISVESRKLYEFIRVKHPLLKKFKDHIYYMPNGVDENKLSPLIKNFDEKENIILHIGRLGTYQKGSEIILEAFAKVARDFPTWKLILIGHMQDTFTGYFKKFLERNNHILDRISYLGFINHRERVCEYYNRAKILAFPSRFESFGIVAVEAGVFGDVILGTDIPPVREITNNGNFGCLCPIDNVKCFTETLRYLLSHEDELIKKSEFFRKFVRDNYNWNKICGSLHEIIFKRLKDRARTSFMR